MEQSVLRSVRIFRKSGIGLDYYKTKDFMSRVVERQQQISILLVINQHQEEQDRNRTLMLKILIAL